MTETITVEISPKCNYKCPECLVKSRLEIPNSKRRDNVNLVDLLVEYVPKNSTLLFIGLGETLLPLGQERILDVLNQREDISGYAQTNGSQKLRSELVDYVESGRLEVGVSLDSHHFDGRRGGKGLQIQKELVTSASVAVQQRDLDETIHGIMRELDSCSLDRVLYDPFIIGASQDEGFIETSWEKVRETCHKHLEYFDKNVQPYAQVQLPTFSEMGERYTQNCLDELGLDLNDLEMDWKMHPKGFYVLVADTESQTKVVLNDGSLLLDSTISNRSWEELDTLRGNKIISLEEYVW